MILGQTSTVYRSVTHASVQHKIAIIIVIWYKDGKDEQGNLEEPNYIIGQSECEDIWNWDEEKVICYQLELGK